MLTTIILALIAAFFGSVLANLIFKNKRIRQLISILFSLVIFMVIDFYAIPYYDAFTFESKVKKKYPVINVIAKYYPEIFNDYIEQMKKNILSNNQKEKINQTILLTSDLISKVVQKSISSASTQSIFTYFKVVIKLKKKFYAIDPALVLASEFPERVPNSDFLKIEQNMSKEDLKEKAQAEIELISSASKNKIQSPPSIQDVAHTTQDLEQIKTALNEQYGKDAVDDTFADTLAPFVDPNKSAQIIISLYEAIIAKGEEKAGLIIKVLFSLDEENTSDNLSSTTFPKLKLAHL